MECLIKWFCERCEKMFTDYAPGHGALKAECPNCKGKTDYEQVYELETLQVG